MQVVGATDLNIGRHESYAFVWPNQAMERDCVASTSRSGVAIVEAVEGSKTPLSSHIAAAGL